MRSIILGRPDTESPTYSDLKKRADKVFKFWQRIIFWLVLFVGSFLIFYVFHFHGLVQDESMELAAIGRNIAMGKGGLSAVKFPCFLSQESSIVGSFSLSPPLYGWIQAICFLLGGYKDSSAVMGGIVFFMGTSLLTYALALRLYSRKVALFIFFFTFTNPILLHNSLNGLPTAFLSFLVVLIFYSLVVLPDKYAASLCGIALGLGFLSDYSWSFLVISFLLYLLIFNRKNMLIKIGLFWAGFIVIVSPWIIGWIQSGQSRYFISLNLLWKSSTGLFPGQTALGIYGPSFQSVFLTFPLIIGKIHYGLSRLYRELFVISDNFIGLLFWCAVVYRIQDKRLGRYIGLLCFFLAAVGVWFVIADHHPHELSPFVPMVILFGTGFFFVLIQKINFQKRASLKLILAGFIIMNCLPLLITSRNIPGRNRQDILNSLSYLRTLIREDEVVITDIPEMVGWYGNRSALRIPLNLQMFEEILNDQPRLKYLLLSPKIMSEFSLDPTGQWRKVYLNKSLPGQTRLEQIMLLPGRLELMGDKTILLNRISSRW